MVHRFMIGLGAVTLVIGCGGGDEIAPPAQETPRQAEREAPEAAAAPQTADLADTTVDGPVLTEIPDPCSYLTQNDAEELLGAATGPGMGFDAGGWNCVYDTGEPRRRLVFDMQLGRDASVESTQLGMTIKACQAEILERFDDLGASAALYRNQACDEGLFLWVATDATFQGFPLPLAEREVTRRIHLSISLSPPRTDPAATLEVLRGAAERALERLDE